MPRSLDPLMKARMPDPVVTPAILAALQFRSKWEYVWSGVGPLAWNGKTWLGVGSLGKIAPVSEGTEVKADGTSLTLSGIDIDLLGESMTDVRVGGAAKLYLGLLDSSLGFYGTPYLFFKGQMDPPKVDLGAQKIAITVPLESRIVNLGRANCRRYTDADQRMTHPTDSAFKWVEQLNDIALRWGH